MASWRIKKKSSLTLVATCGRLSIAELGLYLLWHIQFHAKNALHLILSDLVSFPLYTYHPYELPYTSVNGDDAIWSTAMHYEIPPAWIIQFASLISERNFC